MITISIAALGRNYSEKNYMDCSYRFYFPVAICDMATKKGATA